MKRILIIGASSAIAQATAKLFCSQDSEFYLVGRNRQKLDIVKDDLLARGASKVDIDISDPVRLEENEFLISRAELTLGEIDLALIAYGDLTDQKECEASARKTVKALTTNSVSVISLVTVIMQVLEKQNRGTIVVLSSVAGDRGRASNYIYGAAKSCVSTFMQGLSHRLYGTNINAILIKPGFVDTPMTEQFEKGPLWTDPETIAEGIKKAVEKGKTEVYLPWFWWGIMATIKNIPNIIFKRLPL
ncbi:MAG: SDR family oxidoreductase [Gammaproteobacteria bacterium]